MTKPFDLEEVLARIESNLRRAAVSAKPERRLRCGELLLDEDKNTAFIKDAELSLTAKEYRILELLLQYPDKIFPRPICLKASGIVNISVKTIRLTSISAT